MTVRLLRAMRGGRRVKWREDVFGITTNAKTFTRTSVAVSAVLTLTLLAYAYLSLMTLPANVERSLETRNEMTPTRARRHLMSAGNGSDTKSDCKHGEMPWQACCFEKRHGAPGWVVMYISGVLILFIALAIICDDFFVPSLEVITERLSLSEDVAGATFMAAGSSAPELFTSVAGVAVETDVGVGTIVGSAVFNILVIIALTAALAGQVLHLDWRPMIRDSFFYAISVGLFMLFAWDGYVEHWEAIILLCLYISYIVLMKFNPKLMNKMGSWDIWCNRNNAIRDSQDGLDTKVSTKDNPAGSDAEVSGGASDPNGNVRAPAALTVGADNRRGSDRFHHKRGSISQMITNSKTSLRGDEHGAGAPASAEMNGGPVAKSALSHSNMHTIKEGDAETSQSPTTDQPLTSNGKQAKPNNEDGDDDDDNSLQLCPCCPCCPPLRSGTPQRSDENTKMSNFSFVIRWLLFVFSFPFLVMFTWSIPDCSKAHNQKWYIISFLMSVLWIAALSFGIVILVEKVGCLIGIDQYTMGLVVIAVGTSIPDLLSSILVARDGFGDMAVSNAIGSNVFDIDLGLGLPFLIRILIQGRPIDLLSNDEKALLASGQMLIIPHCKFGFILLGILIIILNVFMCARFRLTKKIGVVFFSMYIVFLVYAFVQELVCSKLC